LYFAKNKKLIKSEAILKKHFLTVIALSLTIAAFAACGSEDVPTAATGEANIITAATENDPTANTNNQTANAQDTAANAPAEGTAANEPAQDPGENTNTPAQNPAETTAPPETTAATTTVTEPDEEVINAADFPELTEEIEMPLPYGDNPPAAEATRSFYFPFVQKLDGVPGALLTIVPAEELEIWISDDILSEDAQTSVYSSKNIVSFISDFSLSDSDVKTAMAVFYENTDPQILMGKDVDVIIDGDEAAINKHFASEFSIVKGSKIYSPQWVYENSPNAYKEAGITPAELSAKLAKYKELGLSSEALKALTEKIEGYKG
jgi:hypothetical protein